MQEKNCRFRVRQNALFRLRATKITKALQLAQVFLFGLCCVLFGAVSSAQDMQNEPGMAEETEMSGGASTKSVQGDPEKAMTEGSEPQKNERLDEDGNVIPEPPPPIILQVTGYALYMPSDAKQGKADPKRLRAIRASRLDAYRNLAERVYGISVSGHSSVKDFVLQNDAFSVHLDTVIRGARVVSIAENQQTGIETVLELSLPASFFQCLNNVNSFKNSANCMRPLTASATSHGRNPQNELRRPMNRQYYLR